MTRQAFEEQLAKVAATWMGVRFLHNGRTRSQGVDCLGLILCVMHELGVHLPDGDGQHYAPDWYLHTPEERYLAGFLCHGVPVERNQLKPGDVLLFRPGILTRTQVTAVTHGGVYLGNDEFLHSINGHTVAVASLNARAWRTCYAQALRLKQVLELLHE